MAFPRPRITRLIVILAMSAIGVACLLLAVFSPPYYGSASAVRPWAEEGYQTVFTQVPAARPAPSHESLKYFDRQDRPDSISISFGEPYFKNHTFDAPKILPGSADGGITLEDGSVIRLAAMAMLYPIAAGQVKQVIFDPQTQEVLPPEAWKARYPEAGDTFQLDDIHPGDNPNDPLLFLFFDISKAPNAALRETWIFDARTLTEIRGATNTRSLHGFIRRGMVFHRLHDGPLTIACDFYPPQSQRIKIPAMVGETRRIDDLENEFRVLRLESVPALEDGGPWLIAGSGIIYRCLTAKVKQNGGQTHTFLFLSRVEGPLPIRVSYTAETMDGRVLPPVAASGRHIFAARFAAPVEQIAHFTVSYSMSAQCAVFQLGSIPGLPEENQGVTNLLDVYIPYATCETKDELYTLMEDYTQLRPGARRSPYRTLPVSFPMTFQNVQVRQIFEAYLKSEDYLGIRIDSKEHVFHEREPWWEKLRRKWNSL